ncbi:MAG: nitrite/sulfite reductase [SAR202 cluster bacterium]|nr:nitrite/sulfite reductase [SAR202 cluster bacterium]
MTQTAKQTQWERHLESMKIAPASNGMIPYLPQEVEDYKKEVKAYREGQRPEAAFMSFRLHQGVYGQRQPDSQMFRIKAPGGVLTPDALVAVGQVVEKFAPLKKGHITTRENIQIHHMKLETAAQAMEIIGKAGLSTREACANTVRNVVAPATAGVCHDELFDIMPYLAAYVRYAVRNPLTQDFPRKFKTSFSGCSAHDSIISPLHDYSLIAQVRRENGVEKCGFKILVGGGTSIMPRLGKVLYDFVPVEDYLRVTQAVWIVFNKAEMLRKNRMMARIKVLIDRIGFDAFKAQVEEELKNLAPIDPTPLMALDPVLKETPPALPKSAPAHQSFPQEFLQWKESNVVAQKQKGYFLAYVTIIQGDLSPQQFYGLADIVKKYTGGTARTTPEQSLALRWIPEARLFDVWKALGAIGLNEAGVHTITDVVSCPGTDSCKLGITSSMGLGRAVRSELLAQSDLLEDPLVKQMHVKISGCPNGCGQHHVADIGFHGAAMKGANGQQVPSYELFLGGFYGGRSIDDTTYGQRVPRLKVPAKRVPELVTKITRQYHQDRQPDETFNQYLKRVGVAPITKLVEEFSQIPDLNGHTQELYMDWEKTIAYKVERGEGECSV